MAKIQAWVSEHQGSWNSTNPNKNKNNTFAFLTNLANPTMICITFRPSQKKRGIETWKLTNDFEKLREWFPLQKQLGFTGVISHPPPKNQLFNPPYPTFLGPTSRTQRVETSKVCFGPPGWNWIPSRRRWTKTWMVGRRDPCWQWEGFLVLGKV